MRHIGTFQSKRWGTVTVVAATYERADGPLAVILGTDIGEKLGTLSVNLYRPQCSHDSKDLPPECFYVKTWAENEDLAIEALASGLFTVRDDLPVGRSGYVTAPVWKIKS